MSIKEIERVSRAIYAKVQPVPTDEEWTEIWDWHTDHDVVLEGGEWATVTIARAAIKACSNTPMHSRLVVSGLDGKFLSVLPIPDYMAQGLAAALGVTGVGKHTLPSVTFEMWEDDEE